MTSIHIKGLRKCFDRTVAVDRVDLTIGTGELFFLLGPSGCGKTTLLRMIAGFIDPTDGRIKFDDRDVTEVPPSKRNTGMVFQSYALWPHMTVEQNVAYGLNVRKVERAEKRERVTQALRAVQMESYNARKPAELSGGQQQRVALARALVVQPTVLLLDEPLSNLDAKLRLEMRTEIKRICNETGITTVYVTHDQKEALSMADTVAVLRDGNVVQVGPPRSLYDRPNCRFVADFLGESNFVSAAVETTGDGQVRLETAVGRLDSAAAPPEMAAGAKVTCSIRPEALTFADGRSEPNGITGRRVQTVYLGEIAQHVVECSGGTRLKVLELNPRHLEALGEEVHLAVRPEHVVILEA